MEGQNKKQERAEVRGDIILMGFNNTGVTIWGENKPRLCSWLYCKFYISSMRNRKSQLYNVRAYLPLLSSIISVKGLKAQQLQRDRQNKEA